MSDPKIDSDGTKSTNSETQSVPFGSFQHLRRDDDVSLADIFEVLWGEKKIILFSLIFFFLAGVFHYTFSPVEYKSTSTLLQESDGQGGSEGIRLLNQLGGFSFGGSGNIGGGISPELYPEIIESVDFQQLVLSQPVEFSTYNREMTLLEYFNDHYERPVRDRVYQMVSNYTIKLPITLIGHISNLFASSSNNKSLNSSDSDIVSGEDVLILSPRFKLAMNEVKNRVTLDFEDSLLEIEIMMTDPMAASQVNSIVADRIREYITNYRSVKALKNLEFIEELHETAKTRYELAQLNHANYVDNNQGNLTATATIELERLEDQRDLMFQLYTSTSQRLEEAKIRLQEDTPIFTTIQKPILPSSPEQSTILIIPAFIILGIIVGVALIFGKEGYFYIRNKISGIDSL